jgi:hypothetical protein
MSRTNTVKFTAEPDREVATTDVDATERVPKADHNRRLSLGLEPEAFAAEAGITVEELRDYENTWPDHPFSPMIAERIGRALDRLEGVLPNSEAAGIRQLIDGHGGEVEPAPEDDFERRIRDTAYYMWEAEGRPEGRDQEYWHRAREVCLGQSSLDEQYDAAVDDPDIALDSRL